MDKRDDLDRFFRKKLEERHFEAQPAFWEEAERLLDQADNKPSKKRRFIWWYLLLIGILFLGGISIYSNFNNSTSTNTHLVEKNIPTPFVKPSKQKQNTFSQTPNINTKKTLPKLKKTALPAINSSLKASSKTSTLPIITSNLDIYKKQSFSTPNQSTDNNTFISKNSNYILKQNRISPKTTKTIDNTQITSLPLTHNVSVKATDPQKLKTEETKVKEQTQAISIPNQLPHGTDKFLENRPGFIAMTANKYHYKPLQWFVQGGTNFAYNRGNGSLLTGVYTGIGISFPISKKLALNTEINYIQKKRFIANLQEVIQDKSFSFGSKTTYYIPQHNTSIHSLQLPLALQYEPNAKHQFMIGGFVTYIFYQNLKYNVLESDYLDTSTPLITSSTIQVNGETFNADELYSKFDAGLLFRYERAVFNNWDLGIGLNYSFINFLKQDKLPNNAIEAELFDADLFTITPPITNPKIPFEQKINLQLYLNYEF